MKRCPFCAEEIHEEAVLCKHCHSTLAPVPEPALAPLPGPTRPDAATRAARYAVAALVVLVLATAAKPAWRIYKASRCEPVTWIDWHLAIRRQCLTPAYVCANMTSAKMLADPDLADAYNQGLASGVAPLAGIPDLVARMRHLYGCRPEPGAPAPQSEPRLPEGHPGTIAFPPEAPHTL